MFDEELNWFTWATNNLDWEDKESAVFPKDCMQIGHVLQIVDLSHCQEYVNRSSLPAEP